MSESVRLWTSNQFMQEKINIANVARDAKVSRNTAKKYLIELGLKK